MITTAEQLRKALYLADADAPVTIHVGDPEHGEPQSFEIQGIAVMIGQPGSVKISI